LKEEDLVKIRKVHHSNEDFHLYKAKEKRQMISNAISKSILSKIQNKPSDKELFNNKPVIRAETFTEQ